jgi:hypothetical protein
MHFKEVPAQDSSQVLAPPKAMTIVAMERQNLHEKIVRLRALREAAAAEKTSTDTKVSARQV